MNTEMNLDIEQILSRDRVTVLPGVYDGLSAKLAQKAGAEAAVVTGFSVAATSLGVSDLGIMTQTQLLNSAKTICNSADIPIIVDGDTGYGGPLNVIKLVEELILMGAKGVVLEDQVWPKRCGHMRGKSVVEPAEHIAKIKAAHYAKSQSKSPFVIIARTDSGAIYGIDNAIERSKAYQDAGADMLFVEAPQNLAEIEKISRSLDAPLVLNIIEGGRTPNLTLEHINQLGFSAVLFPLSGIFSAARAIEGAYARLISDGALNFNSSSMYNFDDFNELYELERNFNLSDSFGKK